MTNDDDNNDDEDRREQDWSGSGDSLWVDTLKYLKLLPQNGAIFLQRFAGRLMPCIREG